MQQSKLLLADDHPIVLQGLKLLLEDEFEIAGLARDGDEALQLQKEIGADLVVLDLFMPQTGGLAVAQTLVSESRETKILILSICGEPHYVQQARECGVAGYVIKSCEPDELIQALKVVLDGGTYYSPLLQAPLPQLQTGSTGPKSTRLTARQLQVLSLVAQGRTGKEIAHALQISVKTVEYHKAAISTELGLSSSAEMIRYAIENKLISESDPETR
ncbi:MAG TPA: response regulator transcription factor [Bryobacteraceae bacterium]|nr:response regulator transcription factor [Bryobacteraceae bacterium]